MDCTFRRTTTTKKVPYRERTDVGPTLGTLYTPPLPLLYHSNQLPKPYDQAI